MCFLSDVIELHRAGLTEAMHERCDHRAARAIAETGQGSNSGLGTLACRTEGGSEQGSIARKKSAAWKQSSALQARGWTRANCAPPAERLLG